MMNLFKKLKMQRQENMMTNWMNCVIVMSSGKFEFLQLLKFNLNFNNLFICNREFLAEEEKNGITQFSDDEEDLGKTRT